MTLSDNEVIQIIKTKKYNDDIQNGLDYESRLRIFTEPLFANEVGRERGYAELKGIMQNTLHPDKFQSTLKYFSYPLPIVNITRDISGDINKVFEGRNANFSYTASTTSMQKKVYELLDKVDVRGYISKEGKDVLKNKPNTFVVVDKDKQGVPYLVTVPNSRLEAIKFKEDDCNTVKYIAFEHSEYYNESGKEVKRIAFYDEFSYRVIDVFNDVFEVTVNVPHNLGYCPAKPFLSARLNSINEFDRYNPFAPVLSTMANWTLFDVYLRYAEHYSVFPVVEKAKDACGNDDCENGLISVALENGLMSDPRPCPSCSSSKIIGAGTVVEIDPATFKDENDVSGMFRFIVPPFESVEFEGKKQDHRENFIKKNTTGVSDVMQYEAVNVEQVRSVMEDRRKPLLFISMLLSVLHKWIAKTVSKLGLNTDIKVHANYGSEWFLLSESDVLKLFADAKLTGFPDSELDEIYKLYIETKYKGDPDTINRLVIENNLNPAPYSTLEECYTKFEKGVMNKEDLTIKANFSKYVKRFERENDSLIYFGSENQNMTFSKKIDSIYQTFIKYSKSDESTTNDTSQQGEKQTDKGLNFQTS